MLLYIILITSVCVFSLICFNKYTKQYPKTMKIIFMSACFLILFAYSAFRVNIGYDYLMYSQGFFRMGMDGFSTLEYRGWELGFNLLTKIIVFFTRNVHIYMAIISAICLAGPFYVIYKHSKKVWLSVMLYINLYFFYCTMNFLRQSIAISIVLFAYTFLIDRKFWKFALLILFAAIFHNTVLIMIPVYFIVNFKPSLRVPILYGYLVLWVFISSNATLDLLTQYIPAEYRQSVFLTLGLDLSHIVIPTLFVGAGMFLIIKFINPRNIADSDKPMLMLTNLMYFSYFWILVMLRHALFERFSYYTYVLVILYIPELIAFIDDKYKIYVNKKYNFVLKKNELSETQQKITIKHYRKTRKVMIFVITAGIVTITLFYNIYGLAAYEKGVHGVYPYQSWLPGLDFSSNNNNNNYIDVDYIDSNEDSDKSTELELR